MICIWIIIIFFVISLFMEVTWLLPAILVIAALIWFLYLYEQEKARSNEKEKFNEFKKMIEITIEKMKNILPENLNNLDIFNEYIYIPEILGNVKFINSDYNKVKNKMVYDYIDQLEQLLENQQALHALFDNDNYIKFRKLIDDVNTIPKFKNIIFPILENASLTYFDISATKLDIYDYNFVEITRTTNDKIKPGTYIYAIDELDNLHLWRSPLSRKELPGEVKANEEVKPLIYYIYDTEQVYNKVIIPSENIKDFRLYGTEVPIVTETSNANDLKIGDVILTEFLFGSSYTLLKGLNKMNSTISTSIKDTRKIQMILSDKSDIEFTGIFIFYDFNRIYGNIQNKEMIDFDSKLNLEQNDDISIDNNSIDKVTYQNQNLKDKIIEYKELYEDELISEDEYNELRKKALEL